MSIDIAVEKTLQSLAEITRGMSKEDYQEVLEELRSELFVMLQASKE